MPNLTKPYIIKGFIGGKAGPLLVINTEHNGIIEFRVDDHDEAWRLYGTNVKITIDKLDEDKKRNTAMDKGILKYTLDETKKVKMPVGATILSCQAQHNRFCIWVLADINEEEETRYFEVFATGDIITEEKLSMLSYISTVQFYGGDEVYHVFYLK